MRVGDKVRLRWNGFPQVPKWRDGETGTIVKANYRRVKNDSNVLLIRVELSNEEVITVRSDQIIFLKEEGK